jgi:hypothetical protein
LTSEVYVLRHLRGDGFDVECREEISVPKSMRFGKPLDCFCSVCRDTDLVKSSWVWEY